MHEKVQHLDRPAQIRPLRKEIDAAIARNLDAYSFCLGLPIYPELIDAHIQRVAAVIKDFFAK